MKSNLSCSKAVLEIRAAIAEIIDVANSGHPGSALSLAPVVHVLFSKILRITCADSKWMNRDIFILSNGHACPVIYCTLYLLGYLEKKELLQFRKLGSRTPGHPEANDFIEAATGPLGQGVGQSVGYAIALKNMQKYNTEEHALFNGRVYCIAGDGCIEEGVTFEALSIAGHLQLSNLTVIYDKNRITIDGSLSLSSSEDISKRMEALGFEVFEVENTENEETLASHLQKRSAKPIFIILHTVIAKGSVQEGEAVTHGKPLGKEDVQQLRKRANIPESEAIYFSEETRRTYEKQKNKMKQHFMEWKKLVKSYAVKNSQKSKEIFGEEIEKILDAGDPCWREAAPTCAHLQSAMKYFAANARVFGGSADLATSTKCRAPNVTIFSKECFFGSFVNFGVREHGMCAILSGIAGYGWHRAFCSTFLNFVSYGFPSIRIAAMSRFPYAVFATHDSIGLGEDGPSHQPVEVISLLRSTPGIITFRPCDGIETLFAAHYSLFIRTLPTVVILTRQKVERVPGTTLEGASRGGYIVQKYREAPQAKKILIIATGSEVSLAVKAKALLPQMNIQVVSLISFEIFGLQPKEYIESVLECDISVSLEAASTFGWDKYAAHHIGLDAYGASAPGSDLFEHFGFTPEKVARRISQIVSNYQQ